jgi:hypothetical protein
VHLSNFHQAMEKPSGSPWCTGHEATIIRLRSCKSFEALDHNVQDLGCSGETST